LEKYALQISKLNIFVSERMKKHYIEKYNYISRNDIIIPCYNQNINKNAFNQEKYSIPSFVYAGSVHHWQCIDEMLILFRSIKEQLSSATLTIYTKEQEVVINKLEKYSLNNSVIVKYLPYQELKHELSQFKYGFLLREEHIVNHVATPIKINTYLANGIIPIITNVIDFYNTTLNMLEYKIILSDNLKNIFSHSKKIISFDKNTINVEKMRNEYLAFFHRYYNDDKYIDLIKNSIKKMKV
jgi:hypothetical protein